jgi:hypothetical protein
MLTGIMAIRYSLAGPAQGARERPGEALRFVVAGRAEHQRLVLDLEPPVADDGAGILALGDRMRRQRAASRTLAEPLTAHTTYSAPPASATIWGRPSGPVIAAAASGGGTSASASATASVASGDGASTVTCRATQSSESWAARSRSIAGA